MEIEILETLKGKELFLGRESGTDRLLVYFSINDRIKSFQIGNSGSVSKSVSRALPNQNKAHLSIKIDDNGNLIANNLKSENVTFVNGSQIVSKRISENDKIELGADHYQLPLNTLIQSVFKLVQPSKANPVQKTESNTFNISHLEKVWEDYKNGQREIKEKQKKINLVRSGCGIFTMCAMPTIFFLGPIGYILTGIGILGNIYSFMGIKKSDPQEEMERLTDNLQENYVCPNPECGRFLGNYKYSMMKNQYKMACPYCKSKFEEK